MPRKKFNREQAEKMWSDYSQKLIDSITEMEKEGLEKGYSSYEIERLWQERAKKSEKGKDSKD